MERDEELTETKNKLYFIQSGEVEFWDGPFQLLSTKYAGEVLGIEYVEDSFSMVAGSGLKYRFVQKTSLLELSADDVFTQLKAFYHDNYLKTKA